jgi:hypothetical protein
MEQKIGVMGALGEVIKGLFSLALLILLAGTMLAGMFAEEQPSTTATTAAEETAPPRSKTVQERIDEVMQGNVWTDDAGNSARLVGDTLKVQLHGEPAVWVSTIDGICNAIIDFVPDAFKELPEVKTVEMHWSVDFMDRRGNEFRKEGARVTFTRVNAASINWANMYDERVLELADDAWVHPALLDDE